jgi:hypothetical protein
MKKALLVVVTLFSISQSAVAGVTSVEAVGQKDPWENGIVPSQSVICEKVETKSLPVARDSSRVVSQSVSKSSRSAKGI